MGRATDKGDSMREELSARFTAAQKARVQAAATKCGKTASDFIREAVLERTERLMAEDPLAPFRAFIGQLDAPGTSGRAHKPAYVDALMLKHAPEARRTRELTGSGPEPA